MMMPECGFKLIIWWSTKLISMSVALNWMTNFPFVLWVRCRCVKEQLKLMKFHSKQSYSLRISLLIIPRSSELSHSKFEAKLWRWSWQSTASDWRARQERFNKKYQKEILFRLKKLFSLLLRVRWKYLTGNCEKFLSIVEQYKRKGFH